MIIDQVVLNNCVSWNQFFIELDGNKKNTKESESN
jgi:hypothetical protein